MVPELVIQCITNLGVANPIGTRWQHVVSDHKIATGNGGRLVAVVRTAVAVDGGGAANPESLFTHSIPNRC